MDRRPRLKAASLAEFVKGFVWNRQNSYRDSRQGLQPLQIARDPVQRRFDESRRSGKDDAKNSVRTHCSALINALECTAAGIAHFIHAQSAIQYLALQFVVSFRDPISTRAGSLAKQFSEPEWHKPKPG
ncbi:MAG: hypothetical protein ACPHRE_14420 [Pseudomonadales bacterium]